MLVETQRSGHAVQVDPLDDAFVLSLIAESEVQAREADRRKLRYAIHWAERHTVTHPDQAATWSDCPEVDLRDVEQTIGGTGTPLVAAGCVEPFATALGVSTRSAMRLMSESLDLRYRLPKIWARVEDLTVAPWRARQIAAHTHSLSVEAAAYVDEKLAPVADSAGVTRIERLVTEAAALFDTAAQEEVEDEAKAAWGVRLDHYAGQTWGGTSRLEIIGDTATLTTFHDLISATAHALLDPTLPTTEQPSLQQRQVTALGVIADGGGATSTTTAYLHIDGPAASDEGRDGGSLGHVEGLGPLTTARIREWLTDWLGAGAKFAVQPVIDLNRSDSVDRHDPPTWMRELVTLRDTTCVFPWCEQNSRACDLDHIEPYESPDDGGPPGQTRPANLAPLCRRHHRAKTFRGWTYHRNRDGTYTWTSPHGERFTVHPDGTVTRGRTVKP